MKKRLLIITLLLAPLSIGADDFFALPFDTTWANWEKRFDRAFEGIKPIHISGRNMGIIVPGHNRLDTLPLSAISYESIASERFNTVVILIPAPSGYDLDGLAFPNIDALETNVGRFPVATYLASQIENLELNMIIDNKSFYPDVPPILENQLAALKYILKGRSTKIKVLPIFVKFSDLNSQVKDYAPMLAELIKDLVLEEDIIFIMTGVLTQTSSPSKLISTDGRWLNAIRNTDVESIIEIELLPTEKGELLVSPDIDVLAMGILTLQWLGADHGRILAYADSSQLVLTKDKNIPVGYVAAAFAGGPLAPPKIEHVGRSKIVNTFDEVFRTDILTMTRQTVASILDPTAAKPPNLVQKQARKKWPVYISLYNAEGTLRGQAGSHKAKGPFQESISQYSYDAVLEAKPHITTDKFQNYIVDVSIPYGFTNVNNPDDLVPLLHGVIVHHRHKNSAIHPDTWRVYGDPHQLLSLICHDLKLKPWAYATSKAKVESFRILSFNEKEPFQDLGDEKKNKKKKKKEGGDDFSDEDFGGAELLPF